MSAGLLRARRAHLLVALALLAGLLAALGPPHAWFATPADNDWRSVRHWHVAWPRAVLAAMLGSGLGAAGWICQRLAHNPLASPALLGVPAAAATGVLTLIAFCGDVVLHAFAIPSAAMAGGLLAGGLLVAIAELRFAWHGTRLLLVGIALGALFTAATFAIALHMDPFAYRFAMAWLAGSLATSSWADVGRLYVPWALLLALCLRCTPPLLLLGFDDDTAGSLGVAPRRWRRTAFLLAVALTALCVSGGGAFAFVGFAAPHLARRSGGTSADTPATAACVGAALLLLADGLVQSGALGRSAPTGVVLAGLCLPWIALELLFAADRRSS